MGTAATLQRIKNDISTFLRGKSTLAPRKNQTMIRTTVVIATAIGVLLTVGSAQAEVNVEQIVAQKVQPILPKGGE
jgi:hypothetical protein